MKYPEKNLYFLYGNDESKLNECRMYLVENFLTKEEREENYIEFSPKPSRKKQSLTEIMPDLLAELGTVSFFPDSRRVIVVYNLEELYHLSFSSKSSPGKKKKKEGKDEPSREAYFIKYLEDQLLKSSNILILVNVENYEENLRVNEKSNLFKAFRKLGHDEKFSERRLSWDFEDAFRERNLSKSLEIIRSWMRKNEDSAKKGIFNSLLKQITLMLQAKVEQSKRTNINADLSQLLFPQNLKFHISKEQDFIQKKIRRRQKNYTVSELMDALQKLLKINAILYPRTSDLYVPDFQLVIEHFIIDLIKNKKR
ncbi:hypothetical protein JW926_01020 [Candidatus Sumerlaeota bacterium]|nr:hypothetical protein [Candidatus Sumerlaeota bacterium]